MFPSVLFNLNWKRHISNFWEKKQKKHLTSKRHQLFNASPADLSVLLPFSCYLCARLRCWQLRNTTTAFSKSHKSTLNILSFFHPPNSTTTTTTTPPVPLSVSLDVDNGIFCGQVTKTERMWVCVRLCVCPPPYCHRLSGPERERQSDKVTAGPYFSLPLWSSRGHKTWCDCWEGRRERKKKNCCCYKSHSHSEGLALWKIAILSFFTKRIWSFEYPDILKSLHKQQDWTTKSDIVIFLTKYLDIDISTIL